MRLILASESRARKKLLETTPFKFSVTPTNINEDAIIGKTPKDTLMKRASAKSSAFAKNHPQVKNCVVITADSGVILGKTLFGKPVALPQARKMLLALSSKQHIFATAVNLTIITQNKNQKITSYKIYRETKVKFTKLTSKSVDNYLKYSGNKLLSFAGAYSLIDTPQTFITKTEGSLTNIVGLPLEDILPLITKYQLI